MLAFGTLGIVFGDIGTSPIYAFRETFHHAELEVSEVTAYGAASVAFWALVIVISLKYLLIVMRADNHGEGGILALDVAGHPAGGPDRLADRGRGGHARRVRHRAAVRRRPHHAGHLGAVGGGRLRSRHARRSPTG